MGVAVVNRRAGHPGRRDFLRLGPVRCAPSARPRQGGNLQPPGTAVPSVARANAPSVSQDLQAGAWGRPEWIVQNALRANPLTAPYPIAVSWRDGVVVLLGRVGTKQVHDAAVQMAIACGFPFRDDLVIDTAETFRVAMSATPSMTGYGALAPNLSASYYVYPQPLFGWLDDPFFGMEPPLVSFAPWWRNRLPVPMAGPNGAGPSGANPIAVPQGGGQAAPNPGSVPVPGPAAAGNAPGGAENPAVAPDGAANPFQPPPAKGDVEITVDASGQVFLRGVVASEEIAREIEQTAWSVPGVTRVVTQFQVKPQRAAMAGQEAPPPLPQPVVGRGRGPRTGPSRGGSMRPHPRRFLPRPPSHPSRTSPRTLPQPFRLPNPPAISCGRPGSRSGSRAGSSTRSGSAPLWPVMPIEVRTTGDAVMLSGQVPFGLRGHARLSGGPADPRRPRRRRSPGVPRPRRGPSQPLVQKGRPEDIEPYLTAQMSRHVGDLAHIDSVRARGDHLEIRGTLLDAADKDRVLAILRSIPVLHGFRLDADPDGRLKPSQPALVSCQRSLGTLPRRP